MVCLFGLPFILIKHLNLVRVEPSYTFFPRRGGVGEFNPRTRFPLSVATQVYGTLLQAFSLKDGEPRSPPNPSPYHGPSESFKQSLKPLLSNSICKM